MEQFLQLKIHFRIYCIIFFITEHRKNYPHMHQPLRIGCKSMKRRNSQNTSQQSPQPQHPTSKEDITRKDSSIPNILNDSTIDISDKSSATNIPYLNSAVQSPILEKSALSTTTLRSPSIKPEDSDTGKFD